MKASLCYTLLPTCLVRLIYKGVFTTLFFLFFSSCSTPCREWVYEETNAICPSYASSQISLTGSSTYCPIRIVIVQTVSGMRMYVDLLQLLAPPDPSDPTLALIFVTTNEETYPISAYRFEGCQRLMIPSDAADDLIDLLLNGQTFTIQIGSYKTDVIPAGFEPAYSALKA